MNEQHDENFSFCPKCGALMENGVCPHCDSQSEEGVYSSQNYPHLTDMHTDTSQDPYGQKPYPNSQPGYQNSQPGYQNRQQGYQNSQPGYQNGQGYPNGQQGYQNSWPGYQNGQHGCPNGQPGYQNAQQGYSNGQPSCPNYNPYNPYMKPKKDNKVWIIVGVAAAAFILLLTLIGSFCYGLFISKMMNTMGPFGLYTDEYDSGSNANGDQNSAPYAETEEDAQKEEEEEEYVPSPEDEYYYGPCNFIDENVDYSLVRKAYTNEDPDNDIDIAINYYELKGENIPNIDKLNEAIEKIALYYAEDFPKNSYYAKYGNSYCVYTSAYVTYNDADILSIVFDEYVVIDNEYHVDLYPVNIDIKNGVILDNDSLLDMNKEFAQEFRRRNNEQNGHIDYLDSLSDEQLLQALKNKNSVIAYYTPLGMEVGLNYDSGWVTVTYKDYEKYLIRF